MERLNISAPLETGQVYIIDGGFSTQLMKYVDGVDEDPLWTARSVVNNPEKVEQVHMDFLKAGARILLTDSYQISQHGFKEHLGLDAESTKQSILKTVELARSAMLKCGKPPGYVLVGGSVGPYGACQHDGSEYTGAYIDSMSRDELVAWHLPRIRALINGGVDFIAAETLPSWREALAILDCLVATGGFTPVWVSFTLKSANQLAADGESLQDAIKNLRKHELFKKGRLFAVGLNCCSPSVISGGIAEIRTVTKTLPIVVYPNSGETWNGKTRRWEVDVTAGGKKSTDWSDVIKDWLRHGVVAVGGCCRVDADKLNGIRLEVAKAIVNNP